MRSLILAAGEGTRLGQLTADRPKPMLPVGGRPILEHLVALLRRHGIREIAVNLHHKPKILTDYFEDGARFGVDITYSVEPILLGSAGAVKRLEGYFEHGEPFLVLYGDVLADVDLGNLIAAHCRFGGLATLALYEVEDPSRAGIVELDPGGRIVRFIEKPRTGTITGNLANAGIYVLERRVLELIPGGCVVDFGTDVFPALLAQGQLLYGVRTEGYLLDIGAPERYAQAEADFQAGMFRSSALEPADFAGGDL